MEDSKKSHPMFLVFPAPDATLKETWLVLLVLTEVCGWTELKKEKERINIFPCFRPTLMEAAQISVREGLGEGKKQIASILPLISGAWLHNQASSENRKGCENSRSNNNNRWQVSILSPEDITQVTTCTWCCSWLPILPVAATHKQAFLEVPFPMIWCDQLVLGEIWQSVLGRWLGIRTS